MSQRRSFMYLSAAVLTAGITLFAAAQTNPSTTPAIVPATARSAQPPATVHPLTLSHITPDGKPHTFEAREKQFLLDKEPTILISGEMHFGRILPDDFELRVKQAKALGLNTVSFYLFWNQVEPREGVFDFTGTNDVRRMLKLCQENGLWAVLRPGPYCCAEVEYGGIPYWTLKYPDVPIRTNDPRYVEWSRKYIQRLAIEVADLQVTRGGPLLMVQMENEYGLIGAANNDYLVSLQKIFKEVGFEVPLFTCDPGSGNRGGRGPAYPAGILHGRNGLRNENDYQQTFNAPGDFPVYAPEVYTAWFSGWGQPIATRYAPIESITNWTNFLLDHNSSFCLYMFFGGTNWGFYNGCNEYLPVQTSYNYSAPIDEAGRTTDKYRALRELLTRRTGISPPPIPSDPPIAAFSAIHFDQSEPLIEWLPAQPTRVSAKPVSMENLDQAYGFVLYRKTFPSGLRGTLELRQAMDYTIVMANGKTIGRSFVGLGLDSNKIAINETGPLTLDLLVYNLGRISVITSSRSQSRAAKGLIGGAFVDDKELTDWQIYSLPMEKIENLKPSASPHTGPTFYHATFNVQSPASTFLDMRNWGFGVVWVNGHNLGRFWDRGALRSLFLSSHFLNAGSNDIVILELQDAPKSPEVAGATQIIETPAVPFAVRLDQRTLAPAPPPR